MKKNGIIIITDESKGKDKQQRTCISFKNWQHQALPYIYYFVLCFLFTRQIKTILKDKRISLKPDIHYSFLQFQCTAFSLCIKFYGSFHFTFTQNWVYIRSTWGGASDALHFWKVATAASHPRTDWLSGTRNLRGLWRCLNAQ